MPIRLGASLPRLTAKAQLHYDPLGRLYEVENFINGVAQGPITMLYDGDALIAEYNSAGAMLKRAACAELVSVCTDRCRAWTIRLRSTVVQA